MSYNNFIFFEQVLELIYNGEFNEMMLDSQDGTNRAIIHYLFKTKCSLEAVEKDLGIEMLDCKNRIINIAKEYDKWNKEKKHESFSKRGR